MRTPHTPSGGHKLLMSLITLLLTSSLSVVSALAERPAAPEPSDEPSAQAGAQSEGSPAEGAAQDEGSATQTDGAPKGVLTRAPELVTFVDAPYPEEAKESKAQAAVVLLLTLDAQGGVSEVTVSESSQSPYPFDQLALEAAKQFKFSPAEIDGKPAPVQIAFKYEFTYQEEVKQVEEKREIGRLSGTVLERGTRRPLAGVEVKLLKRELRGLFALLNALPRHLARELLQGALKVAHPRLARPRLHHRLKRLIGERGGGVAEAVIR